VAQAGVQIHTVLASAPDEAQASGGSRSEAVLLLHSYETGREELTAPIHAKQQSI
jgi:hypothetical protein